MPDETMKLGFGTILSMGVSTSYQASIPRESRPDAERPLPHPATRSRNESADEIECRIGYFTPAAVDSQGMSTVRYLDELRHALVVLLVFECRIGDGSAEPCDPSRPRR